MADKFRLNGEVKNLTFGNTFISGCKDGYFHTIRYDFKPASVDTTKQVTVAIGESNNVTVTVPHIEGAGISQTVFKGVKLPAAKECLLIIDHNTGNIVLERVSQHMRLKKTRPEGNSKKLIQHQSASHDHDRKASPSQNCSPSHTLSRGSGAASSPSISQPSPSHKASPSSKSNSHKPSPNVPPITSGSMPTLGFEEEVKEEVMSESSSDSDSNSGSSSSSDSDSDSESEPPASRPNGNGVVNGSGPNRTSPTSVLSSDLALSSASEDD